MLQAIDNLIGSYIANNGGERGVVLQFEDFSPIEDTQSLPEQVLFEAGQIFIPQSEIHNVIEALAEHMKALHSLKGKDVYGQGMEDFGAE